mgnify:CR=1 FL=1
MDWQDALADPARFAELRADYDTQGYLIFPSVLTAEEVDGLRTALSPYLEPDVTGRNDFEGFRTNRVYAMLAKSPLFAELTIHPLALAFAEAELGRECLLSACLAINIQPGESVQPWHYDDGHYRVPRPRQAYGVSAFWAIDATTEENGATEILPGSHLWSEQTLPGASNPTSFTTAEFAGQQHDPGARPDAVKAVMPAGSLMLAKSTLWHRGGANRSDKPRLIITPQYCVGWGRQLENMILAVPPETAAKLPERARELLGYSIHPPFMGYVDGVHPARTLTAA